MKFLLNAAVVMTMLAITSSASGQSFTDTQKAPGRIIQAPQFESQNQRDVDIWTEDFEN